MNGRRLILSLVLPVSLGISGTLLKADVWDLKEDWSDTSNPNGPWSYNAAGNPLPSQPNFWPMQPGWAYASPYVLGYVPVWLRLAATGPGPDWQVGDIAVHSNDSSGDDVQIANVTWTAPASFVGNVAITGGLWHVNPGNARSNDWRLRVNGNILASGIVADGDIYSRANPNTFSVNATMSAGDIVMLELQRISHYGDFVGINLTIVGTPTDTCVVFEDCDDHDSCSCETCASGICARVDTIFGNVNCTGPTNQVNLDDILCTISGFAALSNCPNADIHPGCIGNDIVNLDDILSVLAAFGGVDPCACQ